MAARKNTVLVVDDDPPILRLTTRSLQLANFSVEQATDGQQAVEHVAASVPDLVLMDILMPVMDGFSACQRIREFSSVPIILLTACGQDQDKIHGLDLGADDYLTKPFNLDELFARVRAVLRRTQFSEPDGSDGPLTTKTIGDFQIDFAQHRVFLAGHEVSLTAVEFRLMAFLAQHAGRVVTQNVLLEHVWGAGYAGESHMLQVSVSRLRRKLEPNPTKPRYIVTKVGVGYILPDQQASAAEEYLGIAPAENYNDPEKSNNKSGAAKG
jgi:DNA-binding response OmpR family regulator